jgi:lysophospholipase L1-like esterase
LDYYEEFDWATVQGVQPGFTQIIQPLPGWDGGMSTVCVCTRPGRYCARWSAWNEYFTFDEPGVYFMTADWCKYYTSYFSITATIDEEFEDGTPSPVNYKGNEFLIFRKGICIGDSVTEGALDHSGGNTLQAGISYPKILQRMTGVELTNAGISGATASSWYAASLDSSTQWGDWVNNEWFWREPQGSSLDYSGYEFAIIHLGINDVGSMGDTPLEEFLNTYEANINTIVNKLKENNKGIKIFMATIVPSYAQAQNPTY